MMALLFSALLSIAGAAEAPVPGRVLWVIDGDTYQVSHPAAPEGEPLRARHFDTPEKGDRAHCEAERIKAQQASALAKRLLPRGSAVLLSDLGRDRYGRLLPTVTLSDRRDLGSLLIGAGLAQPYERGRKPDWCSPSVGIDLTTEKLRGLQPLARPMGKRRAARVVGGRDAPKIRRRIAARPPGFGRYPARPPTRDLASPDSTTGKRFAAHRGSAPERSSQERTSPC